jgi:hypothetical protein
MARSDKNQQQGKTDKLTNEDYDFLAQARQWLGFVLRAIPYVGGVFALLAFFIVWQPLADIRQHTKDLGPLTKLPEDLKATETRLSGATVRVEGKIDGLSQRVSVLETLPKEIARAVTSADETKKIAMQSAASVTAAEKSLASLDTRMANVESKLKQLDQLQTEVKALSDGVTSLDKRVHGLAEVAGRRPTIVTVTLPLKKFAGIDEITPNLRGLRYEFNIADLPAIGGPRAIYAVIEKTELRMSPGKDFLNAIESRIDTNKGKLIVVVVTQASDKEDVSKELADRSAQAVLGISFSVP